MAEIRVKENESLDSALRRFKRSCAKAGVLSEVERENTMKSQALNARRNPRLLENASINLFFC